MRTGYPSRNKFIPYLRVYCSRTETYGADTTATATVTASLTITASASATGYPYDDYVSGLNNGVVLDYWWWPSTEWSLTTTTTVSNLGGGISSFGLENRENFTLSSEFVLGTANLFSVNNTNYTTPLDDGGYHLNICPSVLIDGLTPFTMGYWLYIKDLPTGSPRDLIHTNVGSNTAFYYRGWWIRVEEGGYIGITFGDGRQNGGSNRQSYRSNSPILVNVDDPYLIAIVHEKTLTSSSSMGGTYSWRNGWRLFVNGVDIPVSYLSGSAPYVDWDCNTAAWGVGVSFGGGWTTDGVPGFDAYKSQWFIHYGNLGATLTAGYSHLRRMYEIGMTGATTSTGSVTLTRW